MYSKLFTFVLCGLLFGIAALLFVPLLHMTHQFTLWQIVGFACFQMYAFLYLVFLISALRVMYLAMFNEEFQDEKLSDDDE